MAVANVLPGLPGATQSRYQSGTDGQGLVVFNNASGTKATPTSGAITVQEYIYGCWHRTLISFAAIPQAVVNGTEYQSSLLYTFPVGLVAITAGVFSAQQTTTSDLASTLNSGSTGAVAVGTAAASNVSLTSTMVNIGASTAFTTSTTVNVAGTAVTGVGATALSVVNGTATAGTVYLNTGYATTTDVDADATQTLTGQVLFMWAMIGDI